MTILTTQQGKQMDRFYNVTSMEVLPKFDNYFNVIIKLNFTYGNAEVSLVGSCSLSAPEGEFLPLDQVSKETALEWLLANCPNTTKEFDAQIDAEIARKANNPFVFSWTEPAALKAQ